jgi:molybdate transport system substrate-binding protein
VTDLAADAVRVSMPGAFARLGPELADAFARANADHTTRIQLAAFRPSGLLAEAILAGEPADVYVSANVLWMRRLQRSGHVQRWSTLARNRLCSVAVPGADVGCLRDLLRPGLGVVVPQSATDPCGRYVEQLWHREGMLGDMLAKQARGELLRSVGSGDLPGYLLDGRAQAGMLYLSEARQLDPVRVQTLELRPTDDLRERIRFVVAALGARGEPFARFLLGPEGQSILRAAGFITRRP